MTQLASFETLVDDFEFIDDWEERYKYVIELGKELAPYPEDYRDQAHKVEGCVSQVWLRTRFDDMPVPNTVHFIGDSDALIVRGLIAILIRLLSEQPARTIVEMDVEAKLRQIGLQEHLTPQRSNGLKSMIARIKRDAAMVSS